MSRKKIRRMNILLWLVLVLLHVKRVQLVPPLETMIRSVVYSTKDFLDKFMHQPNTPQQLPSNQIFFGTDLETPSISSECSTCTTIARDILVGTWHIILWSRNVLITSIADLDILIDKLEASQTIRSEKTFYEWLKDPPDVQCPQLTLLNAEDSTKFEIAYRLGESGRAKSIIGKWMRGVDGSYLWQMAPTLSMQLCVAYGEIPHPELMDTIVFTEIGSIPPCDNMIVLSKRFDSIHVSNVRDFLEDRHMEGAFNKLVKIPCTISPVINNTIS